MPWKQTLPLLFLASCAAPSSHWQLTAISTGEPAFDSSRLSYVPDDRLGGIGLELFQADGTLFAYLTSSSRRLSKEDLVKVHFTFGEETFEIDLPLHEGRMRARLPDEAAAKAARALQEGQPVAIMIGSMEQTFQPERFSTLYDQLTGGIVSFLDSFQGFSQ